MISKFIAWLIELFRPKSKRQSELEIDKKKLKENLEKIDEKKLSDSDIINIIDK